MFTKPKNVDAAIAPLLKTVNDLKTVTEAKDRQIVQNTVKITRLLSENVAAANESDRAVQILKALEAIVDPKEGA